MIVIQILGPPKSGKTNIASAITTRLRELGYKVQITDGDPGVMHQQDANAEVHVYTEKQKVK